MAARLHQRKKSSEKRLGIRKRYGHEVGARHQDPTEGARKNWFARGWAWFESTRAGKYGVGLGNLGRFFISAALVASCMVIGSFWPWDDGLVLAVVGFFLVVAAFVGLMIAIGTAPGPTPEEAARRRANDKAQSIHLEVAIARVAPVVWISCTFLGAGFSGMAGYLSLFAGHSIPAIGYIVAMGLGFVFLWIGSRNLPFSYASNVIEFKQFRAVVLMQGSLAVLFGSTMRTVLGEAIQRALFAGTVTWLVGALAGLLVQARINRLELEASKPRRPTAWELRSSRPLPPTRRPRRVVHGQSHNATSRPQGGHR